ncbi:MAG: domain containing protein [Rhizobacter sp.]|nr:domain containing protein [Rhizobacter sp.]
MNLTAFPNDLSPLSIVAGPGTGRRWKVGLVATAIAIVLAGCNGDDSDPVPVVMPPVNVAPIANSGATQSTLVDTQLVLDASASTDANADALTYLWSITSKPLGSSATLSSTTAVKPSFTADLAGTYVFKLVVNDGKVNSDPVTVTISAADDNVAPVANAGSAINALVGAAISLDGSSSSDANGDTLTYAWTMTKPAGSTTSLSNAAAANPRFTPDVAGNYVASLVVSDASLSSAPSTVTAVVSAVNAAPTANAGTSQSVARNAVATLDGSASTDPEGATLSYNWSLTSAPAGSTAALSATNVVSPTLAPDLAGTYVAQLIVNDGQVNSSPVTVTILGNDTAPVANAGSAQTVMRTSQVTLDGSASSDAENDALTYIWSIVSAPSGSTATLSATNVIHPTITPDATGSYVLQLVVNDGQLDSTASTVAVMATPIVTTTDLVTNGSFELGLSSWTQGINLASGAAGSCHYNAATAPGSETTTGVAGYPAADGSMIALGNVVSTSAASAIISCSLYQDVNVPVGATSITFSFETAAKNGAGSSCNSTGFTAGLFATTADPGFTSTRVGASPAMNSSCTAGASLTHREVTFSAASLAGQTVRMAIINAANFSGDAVAGLDNVKLLVTSTN